MPKRTSIVLAGALATALAAASVAPPVTLVVCAPGYPSNTQEAQPSMDRLAAAVTRAAGWPQSRLEAEYQESEAGGLARIKASPFIPRKDKIRGFVYEVETGRLREVS